MRSLPCVVVLGSFVGCGLSTTVKPSNPADLERVNRYAADSTVLLHTAQGRRERVYDARFANDCVRWTDPTTGLSASIPTRDIARITPGTELKWMMLGLLFGTTSGALVGYSLFLSTALTGGDGKNVYIIGITAGLGAAIGVALGAMQGTQSGYSLDGDDRSQLAIPLCPSISDEQPAPR